MNAQMISLLLWQVTILCSPPYNNINLILQVGRVLTLVALLHHLCQHLIVLMMVHSVLHALIIWRWASSPHTKGLEACYCNRKDQMFR